MPVPGWTSRNRNTQHQNTQERELLAFLFPSTSPSFHLFSSLFFEYNTPQFHPISTKPIIMGATTLLILDIQNGIVDNFDQSVTEPYLQRLVKTIAAARNESINIIHVVTAFRQGYLDVHPLNASSGPITATGKYQEGSADVQIHPAVTRLPTEPIVTKRRVSAFVGTELDLLLRCSATDHLVVAGIATSGAVLSTIRQAQDLDFHITILRDLCLDRDEEVHRVLIDKVFGRKTDVFNAEEWVDRIKGQTSS